jgi:hypothetical protein
MGVAYVAHCITLKSQSRQKIELSGNFRSGLHHFGNRWSQDVVYCSKGVRPEVILLTAARVSLIRATLCRSYKCREF